MRDDERLTLIQRVILAHGVKPGKLTENDLLYVLANHETGDGMIEALVALYLGEPF